MTTEFTLKITTVYGTPVFVTHGYDVRLSKVYGHVHDPKTSLWYYPAFYPVHRIVINDMKALKLPYCLSPSAQNVIAQLDLFEQRIKDKELPDNFIFQTEPFEHQLDGLVHLIYYHRSALFYGCGLGKSKIAIDWQRAVGCKPMVLCPKIVMSVWGREVQKHGIEQEYRLVDAASKKGKLKQIAEAKDYPGFVVSYDTAKRYMEELAEVPYDAVVADESHLLKSAQSARTKAAISLAGKAPRRVIMSGTPSLGNPCDVYSQFRFLAPCLMPENFWHFKNKFCETSPFNKHIVVGFKNLDVLQERTSLVAIHRDKEQCLDLPDRTIIDIPVVLEGKQKDLYNTLVSSKEYQEFLTSYLQENELIGAEDDGRVDIPNAAILVNKLLQVTAGFVYKKKEDHICDGCEYVRDCVKLDIQPHTRMCQKDQTPPERLVEYLKENAKLQAVMTKVADVLVEKDTKIIVWAQFISELDLIQDALNAFWTENKKDNALKGHYHVRVDGNTINAANLADIFDKDPKCRVYLGQVTKGIGITLNAASYMIYYSLPWRYDAYEQSLDRNHRVGQTKKTFVYRFLGQGTVDENVARALKTRTSVANVLTAVFLCSVCERQQTCNTLGVEPFEEDCKYDRNVARPVTRAQRI